MDFSHYLEETALGPLQRTEAEFLYNLLRVTKPNNIVEFVFLKVIQQQVLLKQLKITNHI